MDHNLFTTKKSEPVLALTQDEKTLALQRQRDEFSLSALQLAEMAGFSAAMVSRFALGNTASTGEVLGIVSDSLSGLVTLCCLRHLRTAGSRIHLLFLSNAESPESKQLLKALEALGVPVDYVPVEDFAKPEFHTYFAELSECHHCCMTGLYEWPNPDWSSALVNLLNDQSIPSHCIEYPLGIHPDTAEKIAEIQYANSTLALGFPLIGMSKAADYTGRPYLADISLARECLGATPEGAEFPALFAEQPVIPLMPKTNT